MYGHRSEASLPGLRTTRGRGAQTPRLPRGEQPDVLPAPVARPPLYFSASALLCQPGPRGASGAGGCSKPGPPLQPAASVTRQAEAGSPHAAGVASPDPSCCSPGAPLTGPRASAASPGGSLDFGVSVSSHESLLRAPGFPGAAQPPSSVHSFPGGPRSAAEPLPARGCCCPASLRRASRRITAGRPPGLGRLCAPARDGGTGPAHPPQTVSSRCCFSFQHPVLWTPPGAFS